MLDTVKYMWLWDLWCQVYRLYLCIFEVCFEKNIVFKTSVIALCSFYLTKVFGWWLSVYKFNLNYTSLSVYQFNLNYTSLTVYQFNLNYISLSVYQFNLNCTSLICISNQTKLRKSLSISIEFKLHQSHQSINWI